MGATAIVMMDTRPALLPSDLRATKIEYPQLAFELNRAYACAHGYDLLYLHQRSPTCRHQLLGERLPSYCKLAAVAEAFARGYAAAVFLDSDAFLQNVSLGVPALLARYREPRAVAAADVSFASDRPFSLGPNAGIQFWSNTPARRGCCGCGGSCPAAASTRSTILSSTRSSGRCSTSTPSATASRR